MAHTNSIPKLERDAAAAKLYKLGVRSASDFHALCGGRLEGISRPADVPSNPIAYYDGVDSFVEFISIGQQALKSGAFKSDETDDIMSYDALKAVVREHRIVSIREWKQAVKNEILPGKYPTAPHNYYPEFEGWEDFLAPKSARFLDFADAREKATELAKEHNLNTAYHWRWLSRQGLRPKDLPASPDQYYSDFISWKHFYGLISSA